MHTFYINTSGKELPLERGFLDIPEENRQLLFLNCPLTMWMDGTAGYRSCVYQIGEQIDSYEEVDHCFNLVLYVDLFSVKGLAERLHTDDETLRDQDWWVVYALLTHYLNSTLIEHLKNVGLEPKETVILFAAGKNILKENCIMTDECVKEKWETLKKLLGWPNDGELEAVLTAYFEERGEPGAKDSAAFLERILPAGEKELFPEWNRTFAGCVVMFLLSYMENSSLESASARLVEVIFKQYEKEKDKAPSVCFVNNPRGNTREAAEQRLMLTVYLMKCIQSKSLSLPQNKDDGGVEKEVRKIPASLTKEAIDILLEKRRKFREKLSELNSLRDPYYELHMAPYIRTFCHELFGLNEFGGKAGELDGLLPAEVVVQNEEKSFLLSPEGYPLFDKKCDGADDRLFQKNVNPHEYIEEADRVRRHHLHYWDAVKSHMMNVLARYMAKSVDGHPPMIEKRKVSITDEDYAEEAVKDYRYSRDKGRDDRPGEQLQQLAENSYRTVQAEFLRFCAVRPMVLTDPYEQCEWLKNRISQISDTLRKLRRIAGGMAIGFPILYLPYMLLQWSAITAGLTPLIVFAVSAAVPAALLYGIFGILSAAQKRKYREAWNDFRERSNEILAKNIEAVNMQDQLLGTCVPTAKWVYEYKLDVEFYLECCMMAQAKLNHHQTKMRERIRELNTLLGNLEEEEPNEDWETTNDEIDYNVAFCQGAENRKFYAVLTADLLDQFYDK